MKKFSYISLLFLVLVSLSNQAQSQEIPQYIGTPNSAVHIEGRLYIDTLLILPQTDTIHINAPITKGALIFQNSDGLLYFFNGIYWQNLSTKNLVYSKFFLKSLFSDSITSYIDTSSIVLFSDSNTLYVTPSQMGDSLINYLQKSDFVDSMGNYIDTSELVLFSDSTIKYVTPTQLNDSLSGKSDIGDSYTKPQADGRFLQPVDTTSLSNRINQKLTKPLYYYKYPYPIRYPNKGILIKIPRIDPYPSMLLKGVIYGYRNLKQPVDFSMSFYNNYDQASLLFADKFYVGGRDLIDTVRVYRISNNGNDSVYIWIKPHDINLSAIYQFELYHIESSGIPDQTLKIDTIIDAYKPISNIVAEEHPQIIKDAYEGDSISMFLNDAGYINISPVNDTASAIRSDLNQKLDISDTSDLVRKTTPISYGAGIQGSNTIANNLDFNLDYNYLDGRYLSGYKQHEAARITTNSNITLSGLQTIDGITLVDGDRVLVKNQTNGADNGIYIAHSGSWIRATDFDAASPGEVEQGATVFIEQGTTLVKTGWSLSTGGTITVGTTPLDFIQYAGANVYGAQSPITLTGNQFGFDKNVTGLTNYYSETDADNLLNTKVDKVAGKQLSDENYTSGEKTKLAGIATGAEVNVNADWNAVSGDAQILNKPTIPTNNSQLTNGEDYAKNTDVLHTNSTTETKAGKLKVSGLEDDSTNFGKRVAARQITQYYFQNGGTKAEWHNIPIGSKLFAYIGDMNPAGNYAGGAPNNRSGTLIKLSANDNANAVGNFLWFNAGTPDSLYYSNGWVAGRPNWRQIASIEWLRQRGLGNDGNITGTFVGNGDSVLANGFYFFDDDNPTTNPPPTGMGEAVFLSLGKYIGNYLIATDGRQLAVRDAANVWTEYASMSDIPKNNNQLTNGKGFISSETQDLQDVTTLGATTTNKIVLNGVTSSAGGLELGNQGTGKFTIKSLSATTTFTPNIISESGSIGYPLILDMIQPNASSTGFLIRTTKQGTTSDPVTSGYLTTWRNGGNDLVNIDYLGNLTANSFIKQGGTSSQVLMADGSTGTLFDGQYSSLTGTPTIPTNNNQLINGKNYLTSYTETDPIYTADKPSIVTYIGSLSTADLNNEKWTGYKTVYTGGTISNAPTIYNNQHSILIGFSNDFYNTQMFINEVTGKMAVRGFDTNWSGWQNLAVISDLFSGSYNDLTNKPTIPTNNNQIINGEGYIKTETQDLQDVTDNNNATTNKIVLNGVTNSAGGLELGNQGTGKLILTSNSASSTYSARITGTATTGSPLVIEGQQPNGNTGGIVLRSNLSGTKAPITSGNILTINNWATNVAAFDYLGNLTANSFIKQGGTSSQVLMADGSTRTFPSSNLTLQDVTDNGSATTNSITAPHFYKSSDLRLKDLITRKNYNNPLLINLITYRWKNDKRGKRVNYGYSAQQVQQYYPEVIHTDDNGYLSVDYTELHSLLIEKLIKDNENLKHRVSDLEARISKLEKLITK